MTWRHTAGGQPEEGSGKTEGRWEDGRLSLKKCKAESRIAKQRNLKNSRKMKTEEFRNQVSQNIFKRKMRGILEACKKLREVKRTEHDKKVMGLVRKYGRLKDELEFNLPEEISEFSECEIFRSKPNVKQEEPSGPVVVCGKDEDLKLNNKEWQLLARGPKYCMVRGCSEEDMKVEIETAILKHKCMSREDEVSEEEYTEEEKRKMKE